MPRVTTEVNCCYATIPLHIQRRQRIDNPQNERHDLQLTSTEGCTHSVKATVLELALTMRSGEQECLFYKQKTQD